MNSIKDLAEKIKGLAEEHRPHLRTLPESLFLGVIIILVAFGSFGLGRLSKIEGAKTPVRIEGAPETTTSSHSQSLQNSPRNEVLPEEAAQSGGELVGSKNGSKYYYPWCSGAEKISPKNLVYFASRAEAEARGYTPSATCKGL